MAALPRGAQCSGRYCRGAAQSIFQQKPPRTAGREQFGREYAAKFLAACQRHSARPEDALATATALTAETIAQSYKTYILRGMKGRDVDYIVSGGGVRNATLMAMLAAMLEPLGCELAASEEFGLPARPRRPRPLRCSPGRRGITCREMCPERPARHGL